MELTDLTELELMELRDGLMHKIEAINAEMQLRLARERLGGSAFTAAEVKAAKEAVKAKAEAAEGQ